jgi:CTP synthase
MKIAGTSPDGTLVEIVELAAHPWFVAVQYHPEFKSKPNIPHPLFRDFVQACLQRRLGRSVAAAASGDSIRAQG